MRILKQSTAANVMVFMTDVADHITGKASLTLTITASKDGGAFSSITPSVTDQGSGWYNLALTTTHTNTLGDLCLHITGTGCDPSDLAARVVAVDLADAVRFGLTALPNANAAAAGGLYTDSTVIETGVSFLGTMRVLLSAVAGTASGGGTTTITFKDPAGVNTRITMTVSATTGDRSAVTV